jgi:hypothetical protein
MASGCARTNPVCASHRGFQPPHPSLSVSTTTIARACIALLRLPFLHRQAAQRASTIILALEQSAYLSVGSRVASGVGMEEGARVGLGSGDGIATGVGDGVGAAVGDGVGLCTHRTSRLATPDRPHHPPTKLRGIIAPFPPTACASASFVMYQLSCRKDKSRPSWHWRTSVWG